MRRKNSRSSGVGRGQFFYRDAGGLWSAAVWAPGEMVAVLGLLITTQHPLEDAGAVEARMGEAPQDVPLPRLAVSPQWGFASREAENPLTPAAQEAKRRLVAQVAPRGWRR